MTDSGPLGKTRKLFSSTDKSKTSGGKPIHDALVRQRGASRTPTGGQDHSMNPVPSNTPDVWPYQMTMFGLPSLPWSAPKPRSKSRSMGHPAVSHTSISALKTTSGSLPTSPPNDQNARPRPEIAELEAPGASFPALDQFSSDSPSELPFATVELAELEAPPPTPPDLARTQPYESSEDCRIAIVFPEVSELPANPISTPSSELAEVCSHQGVADQPSNGVHNILKEMRAPVQSAKGGYVYFSADADARGLLKLGYTETWDEPWVIGIPDNVVFRPNVSQSNSLGKRIRQRKSTCGLWPVVKLVAPMKHAGRRMKILVRSTLIDNMKEFSDGTDPELFDCSLLQAEQVLRSWQRFSNLQPFTSSGQLETGWGKYVKEGLRGRWNIYLIEKWTSTSLEPMLGRMERRRANMHSEIRDSFQPDQWSALQIIIRAMEEKREESGNGEE